MCLGLQGAEKQGSARRNWEKCREKVGNGGGCGAWG